MIQNVGNIAFVDNHPNFLLSLTPRLEKLGFNVFTFISGVAFLKVFESKSVLFDLVLMDIDMPGEDGFSTLAKVRVMDGFQKCVFVAHSEYTLGISSDDLISLGFDFNIPKTDANVGQTITEILRKKNEVLEKRFLPITKLHQASRDQKRFRKSILREKFLKRLISADVLAILDEDPKKLNPERREIAIGFADINDFTPLTNQYPVEKVGSLLAIFFEMACAAVKKNGGVIDKFVGDELMWFNHKKSSIALNSLDCINTGVEIFKGMASVNKLIQINLRVQRMLKISVGMACGHCHVGTYGSWEHRIQFSAIGGPVNLAARLCSAAPQNQIYIGESIINYCPYAMVKKGFKKYKGFKDKIDTRRVQIPMDLVKNP